MAGITAARRLDTIAIMALITINVIAIIIVHKHLLNIKQWVGIKARVRAHRAVVDTKARVLAHPIAVAIKARDRVGIAAVVVIKVLDQAAHRRVAAIKVPLPVAV